MFASGCKQDRVWGGFLAVLGVAALACSPLDAAESQYLQVVRTFADNVLKYGKDVYGPEHTPLFVDGINIDTHEPAVWKLPAEKAEQYRMPRTWVMSNLASQQNLFRVLVSLTELTGDPKYKEAAAEAIRYAFAHCRRENGLLYWGGHALWDAATEQPVGEGRYDGVAGKHEFKSHLPFYELLWEVDPAVTRTFIESFWTNHVLDWTNLDFNRHGRNLPPDPSVWDHDYVGGPVPFTGKGLTFIHSASDLYYAAAMLYRFTGDRRPLVWAKRLAKRYVEARNATTGLGADNFSLHESHRMIKQFPQFNGRFSEATVTSIYGCRYQRVAITQLKLSELLGPDGEEFKQWAVEDLRAYGRHAYDFSDRMFWSTLIDGTRLSPKDLLNKGYVTERWLDRRMPEPLHFWAYALAYKLTGDPFMWKMCREMACAVGLPMPSEIPGSEPSARTTACSDPYLVFGLLELWKATKNKAWLELARSVGDNIIETRFQKGFFVGGKDYIFAKFDDIAPLALLYLEAAGQGELTKLPVYAASRSFFHGPYEGVGRTYDIRAIYVQRAK